MQRNDAKRLLKQELRIKQNTRYQSPQLKSQMSPTSLGMHNSLMYLFFSSLRSTVFYLSIYSGCQIIIQWAVKGFSFSRFTIW